MTIRTRWTLALTLVVSVSLAGKPLGAEEDGAESPHHHHEMGAADAMSSHHAHMDLHMQWTAARSQTPEDRQRAEGIVKTLRTALQKYKDYRVAEQEGFKPFLPQFPQPMYHFTSYWQGFKAAFRFDPAQPTSLLYKKTAEGYELIGAMYTAPKQTTEETLNERVPLSVARWHAHVNLCFPPRGPDLKSVDWTRFGFRGSIASEEECRQAGGRFWPQMFGWMVHVYPFEQTPEKIWAH